MYGCELENMPRQRTDASCGHSEQMRHCNGTNPHPGFDSRPAVVAVDVLRGFVGTAKQGKRGPEHNHVWECLSCYVPSRDHLGESNTVYPDAKFWPA